MSAKIMVVITMIVMIVSIVLFGIATTNIVDRTYHQAYEQGWTDGANKILDSYVTVTNTVTYKN
jgi:hypothetical protein